MTNQKSHNIQNSLSRNLTCKNKLMFRNSIDHRCRGRPKGSKNRRKESMEKSSEEEFVDESNKKVQEKRGRGRPKGAKNIKKQPMTSSEAY